ncbi:MAG TPA: hypothetical protein VN812_10970, partial [Candidatus Acidoferrales bacterium]|nr:hypothetical protein [Candidatus Acidoferrales bacterium]
MALLILAQLSLLLAPARARIVPLGAAVQANTTSVSADVYGEQPPGLTTLPDGGFVVIWNGAGVPNQPPATGRRFDASGTAVGSEFQLAGVVGIPPIVAANDRLIVSYFSQQGNALVSAFTLDGVLQLTQLVGLPPGTGVRALTLTSSGDLVLTWADLGPVFAQRYGTGDLHPSSPPIVVASADFALNGVTIAGDSSDGFVAAWEADVGNGLWARQFDANNLPLEDVFPVVDPTELAELSGGPSVCVDDSGQFVVGWHDEDHPIEFRRFDAQGNPL